MSGILAGKSVLVTGAASGIGYATACVLARDGARVAVADRNEAGGRTAVESIVRSGGEAIFVSMDVTDDSQVEAAIEACIRAYGRLDGAVNNAGISTEPGAAIIQKTADITESAWQAIFAVNLTGVWRCMRYQIRQMLLQGGGSIVNNASVAGVVGLAGHAAYAASKHGVIGLTKSAAAEYARNKVRINVVCPGLVATPMSERALEENASKVVDQVPLRRLGEPGEIAEAIMWLLSDRASFVVGAALVADGGYAAI